MKRPLVIAHRGGAAVAPENTLAAFERALASGIDGIELDLQLTASGRLVVVHDTLDPGEVLTNVPSLAEVLDLVAARNVEATIVIDIKASPWRVDRQDEGQRLIDVTARPFDVAREMVRVTRPGGRIVMGNWIPGDPTLVAQILKISAAFTPPPPEGFVSPVTWGVEDNVCARFAAAGVAPDAIAFEKAGYRFRLRSRPEVLLETFRDYYGPTMNAYDAAAKAGRTTELHGELLKVFESQNRAKSSETDIVANFLRVTVTKADFDPGPALT